MNGVRFNLRDQRRITSFLDKLDPQTRDSVVDQSLEAVARLTEQRAKEVEIVRGRGRDSAPLATRLSFRSGRLTGSISTDLSKRPRQYIVGTPVAYGPVHERGLGPYPKRPFLQPAADFVIETQAPKVFRKAIERARGSLI